MVSIHYWHRGTQCVLCVSEEVYFDILYNFYLLIMPFPRAQLRRHRYVCAFYDAMCVTNLQRACLQQYPLQP